jgi:hypothetical protein
VAYFCWNGCCHPTTACVLFQKIQHAYCRAKNLTFLASVYFRSFQQGSKSLGIQKSPHFKERIISRFPGPRLQRHKEDRWLNTDRFESPINDRASGEPFIVCWWAAIVARLGFMTLNGVIWESQVLSHSIFATPICHNFKLDGKKSEIT